MSGQRTRPATGSSLHRVFRDAEGRLDKMP